MRRRDFISFLSSATVVAPLAARAQHPARPVIGFLSSSRPGADPPLIAALNGGLGDNGFVDGQNLTIDYAWADGRIDRLPTMAAEHVKRTIRVRAALIGLLEELPFICPVVVAVGSTVMLRFSF